MDEMQQSLIALHNASAKERGKLIRELEAQGLHTEFSHLVYTIIDEQGAQHRLPKQTCPQCHESKLLNEFFGVKNVLPWCKVCRELDPVEAKRAADRMYQSHYPPEKRRAKEQRQKEKYPLRKDYSDAQLQRIARELTCTILREQVGEYVNLQEDLYTPAQQRKILGYTGEIIHQIERYPEQSQAIRQIVATLREESQRLLRIAEQLEHL